MGRSAPILWTRNADGSLSWTLPFPNLLSPMFRMQASPTNLSARRSPLQRRIACLALASIGLFSGCASTSSTAASKELSAPARVSFYDYRGEKSFVLVNEAHTDRVELYSKISDQASTKVASNEVMSALLEFLEDSGFDRQARSGAAPRTSKVWQWGGEIETESGSVFVVVNEQTPTAEKKIFLDCYMNHVQLWSNIFQLQRVKARPGEVFKKPEINR